MDIRFNERALSHLLEAEDGPVGRLVAEKAQAIVNGARANAAAIMHRLPEVVSAIDSEQHGTEAVVGIRDEGSISRYLAEKAAREAEGGWLHRAVAEVFCG